MAAPRLTPDRLEFRRRAEAALAAEPPVWPTPFVLVDLDAFDLNVADLARRAGSKPVRVASKSLRVPELIRRALAHDRFSGVLGYTVAEGLWLAEQGISDDIVVAYPSVDLGAFARLTASEELARAVTVMVDLPEHLDAIDAARTRDVEVRVCLDVDAGLSLAGAHLGPRRSSVHDVTGAARMARLIASRPGFRLVGAMTYEGQVAGVPDRVPGQAPKSLVMRAVKRATLPQLAQRRAAVAHALSQFADLEFWNGGGSGSVESTVADPVVTEVAAGSGLLVPTSFDHFRSFSARPAAYFGLPVTRRADHGSATVHGGGLIASGPSGTDRSPTPWAPEGLSLTALEGAGEVQTVLTGDAARGLHVGDMVWFRHTKSGELFEHTNVAHLLRGERFTDHVPTYRGEGQAF